MKSFFLILAICFTNLIFAQTPNDFTIGVWYEHEAGKDFTYSQVEKLLAKTAQLVNNSNAATIGYTNDFIIFPSISVDESSVVEGGMQNITVTTLELTFYISQIDTRTYFNTYTKKIKGSGNNKEQSITNAINQLTADKNFTNFIVTAKEKILSYYKDNCHTIIQTATNSGSKQNYEEAIAYLESIPTSAPCYQEAQKKALEYYKKYQTVLCTQNMNIARSRIAVNDYDAAFEALDVIDPESTCAAEVKKLIQQISDKVTKREKKDDRLEELRINAIKEIGKAYFASKAKSRNTKR